MHYGLFSNDLFILFLMYSYKNYISIHILDQACPNQMILRVALETHPYPVVKRIYTTGHIRGEGHGLAIPALNAFIWLTILINAYFQGNAVPSGDLYWKL